MGSIYLIRHGQASFGARDYDQLAENGLRQARLLGEFLQAQGLQFDRALSGSLRRQRDTAEAVLGRLPNGPALEEDADFDEFPADEVLRAHLPELLLHEPEALSILRNANEHRAEFQRLFAWIIERWTSSEVQHSGLISWSDFVARVGAALQRILAAAENHQRIAVFTSGGTITAVLQRLLGLSATKAFELNWQIGNTSLTQLRFRNREATLACFNSLAHLQQTRDPALITYR